MNSGSKDVCLHAPGDHGGPCRTSGELKAEVAMVRWMVGLGAAHAGIVVGVVIAVAG